MDAVVGSLFNLGNFAASLGPNANRMRVSHMVVVVVVPVALGRYTSWASCVLASCEVIGAGAARLGLGAAFVFVLLAGIALRCCGHESQTCPQGHNHLLVLQGL